MFVGKMVLDYNRFKSKTRIKVQLKSIKIELWSNFNPFKFDFDPPWIKIHVGTFLTFVPGSGLQRYGFAESRTTCHVHSSIQYCVSKLVIIGVAQSVLMKIVGE